MTRILWIVGTIFALGVPGIPLATTFVARTMTKECILISPADEGVVELNRDMWKSDRDMVAKKDLAAWDKAHPVAALYGNPVDKSIRVYRPDPKYTIVPPEDPKLTLLKVSAEYHPLQLQSILLLAKWLTVASGALAIPILLAAMVRTAKPNPRVAPPPA